MWRSGDIILIGATTENPSFEVISALLSRSKVYRADCALDGPEIVDAAAARAAGFRARAGRQDRRDRSKRLEQIAIYSNGDARAAYNTLELAAVGGSRTGRSPRQRAGRDAAQGAALRQERRRAFQPDLRAAQIRAFERRGCGAVLAGRMLEAGEDRMYIARRLVRMAIEDIGLADPRALEQAVAAKAGVHFLGIPEGDLALAQAAIYLSLAPKSRRCLSGPEWCPAGSPDRQVAAGSDASAQCSHKSDEGVGLRRRIPARSPGIGYDSRNGLPA